MDIKTMFLRAMVAEIVSREGIGYLIHVSSTAPDFCSDPLGFTQSIMWKLQISNLEWKFWLFIANFFSHVRLFCLQCFTSMDMLFLLPDQDRRRLRQLLMNALEFLDIRWCERTTRWTGNLEWLVAGEVVHLRQHVDSFTVRPRSHFCWILLAHRLEQSIIAVTELAVNLRH